MIDAILTETTNWLATDGAPNGVVLLALLTSPAAWSEKAREVMGRALDRFGLGAHSSEKK